MRGLGWRWPARCGDGVTQRQKTKVNRTSPCLAFCPDSYRPPPQLSLRPRAANRWPQRVFFCFYLIWSLSHSSLLRAGHGHRFGRDVLRFRQSPPIPKDLFSLSACRRWPGLGDPALSLGVLGGQVAGVGGSWVHPSCGSAQTC